MVVLIGLSVYRHHPVWMFAWLLIAQIPARQASRGVDIISLPPGCLTGGKWVGEPVTHGFATALSTIAAAGGWGGVGGD